MGVALEKTKRPKKFKKKKNLQLPKETGGREGGEDGLGVLDGNVLKLGCDDGCTAANIIKFIELKK